jgi:hypothetical protein
MKLEMPSRDEISAAEQRFATSKWDVRDDALQLRLAVRSRIAKPSSLAIAAGTAAILGFLLVRRPKPKPAPPPERRKKTAALATQSAVDYALVTVRPRAAHEPHAQCCACAASASAPGATSCICDRTQAGDSVLSSAARAVVALSRLSRAVMRQITRLESVYPHLSFVRRFHLSAPR